MFFHRSLPPPNDSNSNITPTKRNQNGGTMNSQVSNWSAASSAASFDYQPANKQNGGSPSLPSVHEEEHQVEPQGERIPPEGAPAAMSGVSPTNFVQRIEVKSAKRSPSPQKIVPSNKIHVRNHIVFSN